MSSPLPKPVCAFLREHIGAFELVRDASHVDHTAKVYEIRDAASGRPLFLKHHLHRRRFEQECAFYDRFIHPIADRAPRLVARSDNSLCCLIVTALPGVMVETWREDHEDHRAMAREAGRILRRIHDQPYVDDDSMPLLDAMAQRLATAIGRCTELVELHTLKIIERLMDRTELFVDESRVPCHRDYIPRNWIVDDEQDRNTAPVVQIFDFDQARPDARLWDFVRLYDDWSTTAPDLWKALLQGYDIELNDEMQSRLEYLGLINALSMVRWGRDMLDAEFEALGRQSLDVHLRQP